MVATTAQHGAIAYIKLILRIQVLHAKYFFSRLILVSQLLTASTICAFLTLECIQGSVPPPGLSRISKQIIKYLNDSTKETQRKRAKKNSNYAEFPYSFCVQHISRHCQASQTVTDLEGKKYFNWANCLPYFERDTVSLSNQDSLYIPCGLKSKGIQQPGYAK